MHFILGVYIVEKSGWNEINDDVYMRHNLELFHLGSLYNGVNISVNISIPIKVLVFIILMSPGVQQSWSLYSIKFFYLKPYPLFKIISNLLYFHMSRKYPVTPNDQTWTLINWWGSLMRLSGVCQTSWWQLPHQSIPQNWPITAPFLPMLWSTPFHWIWKRKFCWWHHHWCAPGLFCNFNDVNK